MPFSTLPSFGKVTKNVATFSLLPNFGNYIRNPAKILASYKNFDNYTKNLTTIPKFFFYQSEQARNLVLDHIRLPGATEFVALMPA